MFHIAYLGLGTNLGNKKANLRKAIKKIGERVGTVERQSAFYETEPWGFRSDNMFVNAVVRVSTQLTPMQLLRVTQQIERDMGRKKTTTPIRSVGVKECRSVDNCSEDARSSEVQECKSVDNSTSHLSVINSQLSTRSKRVYHDRPIDIDILLYDDWTVDEPELKIPHPLMQERDFVMVPLREIIDEDQVL